LATLLETAVQPRAIEWIDDEQIECVQSGNAYPPPSKITFGGWRFGQAGTPQPGVDRTPTPSKWAKTASSGTIEGNLASIALRDRLGHRSAPQET
jgi:hypothetical protein